MKGPRCYGCDPWERCICKQSAPGKQRRIVRDDMVVDLDEYERSRLDIDDGYDGCDGCGFCAWDGFEAYVSHETYSLAHARRLFVPLMEAFR